MRIGLSLGFGIVLVSVALAQAPQEAKPAARYGVEPRLKAFPQATPKEALASVIQAMEEKRIAYLLAHLTDPDFVDTRVQKVHGGQFEEFVRETTTKLADNPATLRELRRYLKEGDWEGGETNVTAKLKDVKDRQLFLRRIGNRWFLENRQKPEPANQSVEAEVERIPMPEALIDLRSDTVTKPTPGMLAAMQAAEVGDDVFGEDPTVNRLQERVADLLGKEAALFVPSGTMSNQICLKGHTQPGDELLCEATCHIYGFEAGGPAVLSSVMCRTMEGDYGILDVSQLEGKVRANDDHLVRTRLVALENTHNRGGGRVYPIEKIQAISRWAIKSGLLMHLDGARLWNAIVATGIPAAEWARHFDTVSVCFSKGLGAPVGSALAGPAEFVARARRIRKLFGGGMRQAGLIAAAALYALENHIKRLAEDHRNARIIAQAIADTPGLQLEPPEVETNLVWFQVDPDLGSAWDVANALKQRRILVHVPGRQTIRACTHLDVSPAQAERVADTIREALPHLTPVKA